MLSYLSDFGLLSLRYLNTGPETVGGNAPIGNLNDISEFSALYGISAHESYLFVSASAGLGMVLIMEKATRGEDKTNVVGFPLEAQAFISPFRFLGFGAKLIGNLNSKSSYWGILFCLEFGKLR